jgi:hypothetical protein
LKPVTAHVDVSESLHVVDEQLLLHALDELQL